ncbi:MAG: DUF3274 domain-containing protein [Pseudomonadota bacterium]
MAYADVPFSRGKGTGIYVDGRLSDKVVGVRHNLPGSVILVHGVNDVGTSYAAVEEGLCEGLTERLCGDLKSAKYRLPAEADKHKVEDDPDAVFYKRTIAEDTHSPVIPFYWGFREEQHAATPGNKTKHGQAIDRYGNRLDKDFSKGGGPFANATSTLPDMWNRGKSGVFGTLDAAQRDATHPVLNNPGRLYMILAARRLAALITMIRDYDANETVSIVAHSQGCMVSLLAQAFLLDPAMLKDQVNARPADTLILCNPPYSLVDEIPMGAWLADHYSGSDAAMKNRYVLINTEQTLHARLTTLVNLVKAMQQHKHAAPPLDELPNTEKHFGVVGGKWKASGDRDNRGKVYLYFSPEDMTVALANVQGIGWQGVPEYQRGHKLVNNPLVLDSISEEPLVTSHTVQMPAPTVRKPLSELGASFYQRVFTSKRRPDFHNGALVMVGQKNPPHDFALCVKGEDEFAHTAASDSFTGRHGVHGHLDTPGKAPNEASDDERARFGIRKITGEALPKPVYASMCEGAHGDERGRQGASEGVDQIDAAIAATSDYGIATVWECMIDPTHSGSVWQHDKPMSTLRPDLYKGMIGRADDFRQPVAEALNRGKKNEDHCQVLEIYVCLDNAYKPRPIEPTRLLIRRSETATEARLRWQNADVARSFHGAIYGGKRNHREVTAYDVAIGGGNAPTHPLFYEYLCAIADWRLKDPTPPETVRPGILSWMKFNAKYGIYFKDEPEWRKKLIEGNVKYYSKGILPECLPVLPEGLPKAIVSETLGAGGIDVKETKR